MDDANAVNNFADTTPDAEGISGHVPAMMGDAERYEVGDVVAEGGMGAVLSAKDVNIRRQVAMKVMLKGRKSTSAQVARFLEEAQVTGQLEHPNIVPVHELSVNADGDPYYTMKMIKGVTLKDVLEGICCDDSKMIKAYPLSRLLRILIQACNGVAYAHSKGIVHRDLKPDNVMIGEYGEVLVVDWGIAKVLGRAETGSSVSEEVPDWVESDVDSVRRDDQTQMTLQGSTLGTPTFMAPEQIVDASTVDERADMYAIGAMLYVILALRPPVEASSVADLHLKVLRGEIENPCVYNKESEDAAALKGWDATKARDKIVFRHCPNNRIPEALAAVAMKAMALKPEDRYEDVKAFQVDLQAYLNGFATGAEDASFSRQIVLLIRRQWGVFLGAAGVVAIVVALVVGFMLQVSSEKQRAVDSEQEARLAQVDAEESARRAQAVLQDLKATVPVFIEQTRTQIDRGDLSKAVEFADSAIRIDPDAAEAYCLKGHLLQTQLRLPEAVEAYRAALDRRKGYSEAYDGWRLTKRVLAQHEARGGEIAADLVAIADLQELAQRQGRLVESSMLFQRLGKDADEKLRYWKMTIEAAGIQAKVAVGEDGLAIVTLPESAVSLVGFEKLAAIPIGRLVAECPKLSDLAPLRGLAIRRLNLAGSRVSDLSPLSGATVIELDLTNTQVAELSPLEKMPLTHLTLDRTQITDLGPLAEMPLRQLSISYLKNLRGLSTLRGMKLETLHMWATGSKDLTILQGMPLKHFTPAISPQYVTPGQARILYGIKTLETLHKKPVAEYWQSYKKRIGKLPAE